LRSVGSLDRGTERRCGFHSRANSVAGLCAGKDLRDTAALGQRRLGQELFGESAHFPAQTVAPARDLAQSVVASLDLARLRYIEVLVIPRSDPAAAFFTSQAVRFPDCIGRLFGPDELHNVARLQHLRKVLMMSL
jgi:hypothetical protein